MSLDGHEAPLHDFFSALLLHLFLRYGHLPLLILVEPQWARGALEAAPYTPFGAYPLTNSGDLYRSWPFLASTTAVFAVALLLHSLLSLVSFLVTFGRARALARAATTGTTGAIATITGAAIAFFCTATATGGNAACSRDGRAALSGLRKGRDQRKARLYVDTGWFGEVGWGA
jgi:hypothetical protein